MTSRVTRQLKELGRAGLDKLVASFDSWTNDVTGFGTSDDKTTYTRFAGGQLLSLQELSNVYHGDDLGARMVDVVPDEMLREGFTLELGDAGLNQAVNDKFEAIGIDEHFANGIRWGRLYGEGAILIGADDGRSPDQPLIPERARDVGYLYVMDGRYYWPRSYYREAGHPKLGQPETYGVQPPAYAGQPSAVVHESRLIRFGGSPTGAQEREINLSRDYSVLQRAYEALRAFNTGWKAVEILLTDGHQSVFKMQGLAEMIGSGGEALAAARLKVINLYRSVLRAIVVDAGDKEGGIGAEDFTRNSVSFSDIPNTLDKFMLRLAAAVQIPVTILMGQSPAGMNATGESDFRWFYDRIRSEQTRRLAPKIRRLTQVLLATKNWKPQKAPKALVVNFPLLWTETPAQAAQTRSALITGDAALVTAAIALPEEVALQRLKPGGYAQELVLTPEGVKVRTAALSAELTAILPDDVKADRPNIELAPTDAAQVIKVNEARASMSLPPLDGPDGELTLAEFAAKSAPAPGGGFGGPPGGGPPKLPAAPAAKPPGGGAPPPFAKEGEEAETKTDADEYERDEAGRFAPTGGGGGASGAAAGGGGAGDSGRATRQAAVAKARLEQAKANHEKAKAEHEAAKTELEKTKAEAQAKLETRQAERAEAAAKAAEYAKEAKAEASKLKSEIKELERAQRKLPRDEDGYVLPSHKEQDAEFDAKVREREQTLDRLSEHAAALGREARANGPNVKLEKARQAIAAADGKALNKLESNDENASSKALGTNTEAQQAYLRDRELVTEHGEAGAHKIINSPFGSPEHEILSAKEDAVWSRFNGGFARDEKDPVKVLAFHENQSRNSFPDLTETDHARTAAKVERTARAVRVHEREVKRREKSASHTKADAGDYERDDVGRFAGSGDGGSGGGGSGSGGGSAHAAAKADVSARETAFHAANEAKRAEAARQISTLEKQLPGAAAAKKEALAAHKADLKAAGIKAAPELDKLTNARAALETAQRNSGGQGTDAFTAKDVEDRQARLAEAERAAAPLFERMPPGAAERHALSAKRGGEYDDVKTELGYYRSQARDCETRERAAGELKKALHAGDVKAAGRAQAQIDKANENSDEPALTALGSTDNRNGLDAREYVRIARGASEDDDE